MGKFFKIYYQFLWRRPKRFIFFELAVIISAVLLGFQPYFYKLFVSVLSQPDLNKVFNVLIFFVLVKVFTNLFSVLAYYLGDRVLIPAAQEARTTVFKRVQDLDFAYHTQKSTGSLISAFKRGDNAFFDLFHSLNINLIRILVGFLVMLFFFSQLGTWVVVLLIAIVLSASMLIYYLIRLNVGKNRLFNKKEDQISGIITDNLINYETVKYFAQEKEERNRLDSALDEWRQALWGFANTFRLMDLSLGVVSNAGIFLIMFFAWRKLSVQAIAAEDFILVLGFLTSFFPRLYELFFNLRDITRRYVDLQKYFAVLKEEIRVKEPKKSIHLENMRGEIEFSNVCFSYPQGKKDALKNFNFKIKSGESVALVGSSGAGKTTVVKLLLRFYDIDQGKITIDGINIKNFSKTYLRSQIGVVPQEPILFNETILFNIVYGFPQASKDEIERAMTIANLTGFIKDLPDGYQTLVGERGVNLSGGQKQRVAIARMILENPKIIIFDEATSQLDSQSERLIQKSFWRAREGCSTIIIAHRLSTVKRADRIVVIEDGVVAEEGSHEELLRAENGLYRGFWRLQTREENIK